MERGLSSDPEGASEDNFIIDVTIAPVPILGIYSTNCSVSSFTHVTKVSYNLGRAGGLAS
jgi:hypothetical protein